MAYIWSEERIREEIARLDTLTGLNGRELPITFSTARKTLGQFAHSATKPLYFRFSRFRFEDPDFPEESALDVIRHEYAHYMDYTLNGSTSHGSKWKACCRKIGAPPERLFNRERCQHFRSLHEKYLQQMEARDRIRNTFRVGERLLHPRYGAGSIVDITFDGDSSRITLIFPDGHRTLNLDWAAQYCTLLKSS